MIRSYSRNTQEGNDKLLREQREAAEWANPKLELLDAIEFGAS